MTITKQIINISNKEIFFAITLLLAYETLTYIPSAIPQGFVKIIYFSIITALFLFNIIIKNNGRFIKSKIINTSFWISAFFCLAYLIRITINLYIDDIFHTIYSNKITYLYVFTFATLVPLIGLNIGNWHEINIKKVKFYLSVIFNTCLLISLFYALGMRYISIDGRFSANQFMDPIAYGHLGVTVILLNITTVQSIKKRLIKVVLFASSILAAMSIGLANSRSPVLALLICMLIYILLNFKVKKLVVLSIVSLFFFLNLNLINSFLVSQGSFFVNRMISTINANDLSQVTSSRNILYEAAIEIIKESPIIGKTFIMQSQQGRGLYAHNFILESFMALGMLGGLMFLVLLFLTIKNAYKLSKLNFNKYSFFILLYLQYFVYAMFSRSMVNLPLFWISTFLINSFYASEKLKLNFKAL